MSRAVYAAGHWRRRDPLEGLSEPMLRAIDAASLADLALGDGGYRFEQMAGRAIAPATVYALADRGLLRFAAGPDGDRTAFRITAKGRIVAAEILRRREARRTLSRRAAS